MSISLASATHSGPAYRTFSPLGSVENFPRRIRRGIHIFHSGMRHWEFDKCTLFPDRLPISGLRVMDARCGLHVGLRHVAGYFDSSSSKVPGRFVPMHFRSPERIDHTVNVRSRQRNCLVGGPNIRSHELSSPTTVAVLGSIGLLDTPCTIMSFLTMTIAYTI